MKKKILLLNKISAAGLECLDEEKYEYGTAVENADAIMVRSAKMHDMEFSDNLRAIARCGAGVNNIPVDRCTQNGIVVFNTPGANANGVKELAVCALVLASRDVVGGVTWANTLQGEKDVAKAVEEGKGKFVGNELVGKTLGVIGLGAIGGMVANVAVSLGMNVIGYDPYITARAAWSIAPAVKQAGSYEEIFKKCDYITLHVPATEQTRGMICESSISMMKTGAKIINLARAELVNVADVKKALEEKKLGKYVTDFPTEEIINVNGILAIPHLGASTYESEDHCAVMATKQLSEYLLNGNIVNSVNFPSVSLAHTSLARVCLMHKNIPNMLAQIASAFSAEGINIENLANGSKGEMAYTILEAGNMPKESLKKTLLGIDGVINVSFYN